MTQDDTFSRFLHLAILITAVALFLYSQWNFRDTLEDDAYISFRYARNLVRGEGLVFNPGERVEGFTNMSWTLYLAALHFFGIDFERAAMVSGAILGALLLILVSRTRMDMRSNAATRFSSPAALLLALNPAFQAEAAMGLETVCFTLLVFLAIEHAILEMERPGGVPLSALFAALALWTRPEGLWIAGYVFLFRLGVAVARHHSMKPAVRFAAITGASALLLFSFRWMYYGDILPNTYYAKTGGGVLQWIRGWGYLHHFLTSFGIFACVIPLAFLMVRSRKRIYAAFLSGYVALYFLYVVYVGGDYKPSHRFLIHVMPILYLGLLWFFYEALDWILSMFPAAKRIRYRKELIVLALCGGYLFTSLPRFQDIYEFMRQSHGKTRLDRLAGGWFRRHAAPGETLATEVIGRIPYYSGMITYDMSGLTDRHIARLHPEHLGAGPAGHEKTDAAYILAKKPTYILFHSIIYTNAPNPSLKRRAVNYFEAEMWKEPEFHRRYVLRSAPLVDGELYFNFFKRADAGREAAGWP